MYAPGSVIDLLRVSAMSHDPAIDHGDVLAPNRLTMKANLAVKLV